MIRKIYTLLILGLCLGFAACSDDNDGLDPNAAAPVIKFPMEQLDVDLNKVDNLPVVAVIKSQAGLQSVTMKLRKISKEKNVMKQDIQRIMLAAAKPLFLIFILYILKIMEVGMDWDFSRLGVYPMEKRGLVGILTHPLIHSGFSHLLANTIPLFFTFTGG